LILSCSRNQLEHLPNPLVCDIRVGVAVPSDLAPFFGLTDQLLFGVGADFDWAELVEAVVDELLWAERPVLLDPIDDRTDAGQ
jgi:hypothetical protein